MSAFTLMSDTGGEIQEIAIILWQSWLDNAHRREAIENFIALSGTTSIVAVIAESSRAATSSWLQAVAPGRYRICVVDDDEFKSSNAWTRDSFLNANVTSGSRVIVKPGTARPGKLDRWLSSSLSLPLHPVGASLDGGDSLVVDDSHWIVGAGAVHLTMRRAGCTWSQAVQRIQQDIGRTPTIAGHRRQAFLNRLLALPDRTRCKMSVPGSTAASRFERWLSLAPRLLSAFREALRDAFASGELHSNWAHIDMVVSVTGTYDAAGKPILLVADTTAPECPQSEAAARQGNRLNSLAEVLTAAGVAVRRNPAPYVKSRVLPYNNTLVQTNPKTVWLPTFTADDLDARAADETNVRIWRELGFTDIRPVQGWSAFLTSEGSLRCATLPMMRR